MNQQEFAQGQVDQLDGWINETRVGIEHLMQREEYLLSQREKWAKIAGGVAVSEVFERHLIALPGGNMPDGAA